MPMIGECMNFCSRCGDEGHPDHECPSYPAARAPHVDAARCSIQQRDVPEEILPAPNVLIRSVCLCVCRSLSLPLSPLVFSLCFSVSAPRWEAHARRQQLHVPLHCRLEQWSVLRRGELPGSHRCDCRVLGRPPAAHVRCWCYHLQWGERSNCSGLSFRFIVYGVV